ncbi:hypothetical protein FB567DRAFT_454047 [Paraphoma chrysanthemicola]|uniref:DUF1746 domain-containing protein n=1 Tax=Paraphoma chrysanthemicola TaxID=798071 RepID=A0A8K0VTV9_9PLEO|nr:hypothetical protein FB567DRAFT_454047 [Paraphoma chrysanthemicola]
MNDAGESSGAVQHQHHEHGVLSHDEADHERTTDVDEHEHEHEHEARRLKAQLVKERRLDAKRKRIRMLNDVLRELDLAVYMQLITIYHCDCSFFWFAVRAVLHGTLLTPTADPVGERPPDEPKPFLPVVLFAFVANLLLHQLYPAPAAAEDTRGYLHGGLMIDFIGQQGPTSKWTLGALDVCVLCLQLVMVSVHVKRRELKKKLAKLSAGAASAPPRSEGDDDPAPSEEADSHAAEAQARENAAREQDADDEERGLLRRSDTLSDVGLDPDDDEDALLSSAATDAAHPDALDILTSGQCVIGDFSLIDTLLQENKNYSAYRLTRTESGINDMPETLRRLNTLRTRFGVGGG